MKTAFELPVQNETETAKIFIRSLLASTNSDNIEANTNFLYTLITGGEV